jgi:hypothetical protein
MSNQPLLHVPHQVLGHYQPIPTSLHIALIANRSDAAEHDSGSKAPPNGHRRVHVDRETWILLEQRDLFLESAEKLPCSLDTDAADLLQL